MSDQFPAVRYPHASAEPLNIIRTNECERRQHELRTQRFQAFWNEIDRLRVMVIHYADQAGVPEMEIRTILQHV